MNPIPMPADAAGTCAWIGLAGPTAGGKSALALTLAAEFARRGRAIEIVSVDSALVYRGMDIGTAKPSRQERDAVAHHLIDLIDPAEAYSAARFVQDARRLVGAIRARGALPLLVGGTMLYFKALIDGLDAMPAADPALRAAIEARARREGWPALHAELARVDPVSAARLAPHDAQRVQRALEVWQASGVPLSQWQRRQAPIAEDTGTAESSEADDGPEAAAAREGAAPAAAMPAGLQRDALGAPYLLLSLEGSPRDALHRRIAARFEAMLQAGLVDEVRHLRARGDLHAGLPSMRCVGYRQAWEMLDGAWPESELAARGSAATRQLAKRQMTWLRSLPQRRVLDAGVGDPQAEVVAQVQAGVPTEAQDAAARQALAAIDAFEALVSVTEPQTHEADRTGP